MGTNFDKGEEMSQNEEMTPAQNRVLDKIKANDGENNPGIRFFTAGGVGSIVYFL